MTPGIWALYIFIQTIMCILCFCEIHWRNEIGFGRYRQSNTPFKRKGLVYERRKAKNPHTKKPIITNCLNRPYAVFSRSDECKYLTRFALKWSRLETLFLFQRNFQEKKRKRKLHFYPGYLCSLKESIGKWEFFVNKYQDISSLCGWINVLKYSCSTRQVYCLNYTV